MAASLIAGLLGRGHPARCLRAADPVPDQRLALTQAHGIAVFADNDQATKDADVVVLAVKPQVLRTVCQGLAAAWAGQPTPLIISIAAGIRSTDIQRWLGGQATVVRAMPNTPALLGAGATALYASSQVTIAQRQQAENILQAAGVTVWLLQEDEMDLVTALSGSGPAYFFLVMESLAAAATELGLAADTAALLTRQTALGAARMAIETGEDLPTLRRRVTSPGGTTECGVAALEQGQLRALLKQTLVAAQTRSKELAEQLGMD